MTDDGLTQLAARGIALARIGIGIGATVAPAAVSRLQFGSTTPGQTMTVRMLGARDLALGFGALLAARHDSARLRGWVEAGGMADAIDALTFLRADRDEAQQRGLTVLAAGCAAVLSAWAARRLTD
ncbi:MAG TPA: hypothetical protein VFZ70_01970 [Euzebyales bacterium]